MLRVEKGQTSLSWLFQFSHLLVVWLNFSPHLCSILANEQHKLAMYDQTNLSYVRSGFYGGDTQRQGVQGMVLLGVSPQVAPEKNNGT
mmetsp:Transcript_2177/g.3088  ORF Transcript_2177/g.3088 Transcript_2177/m.3088 type:complete len:88 (-) Transcript_2177:56-319(-)